MDPRMEDLLDPSYWDGHMFGDDCAPFVRPEETVSLRGCARFAKDRLREHFASGDNPAFPLETFTKGKTFAPNAYDPGTVLLFDREQLCHTARRADADGDAFAAVREKRASNVPQRPADLPPNILFEQAEGGRFRSSNNPPADYMRTVYWGVVAPTKNGPNIIVQMSSERMGRSARNGKLLILATPMSRVAPIEIGDTQHQSALISRTNVLQVCANGRAEKSRSPKWLPDFLGKLAIDS